MENEKYLGEGCRCRICKKLHYCPDGCAMHYKDDECICNDCYFKAPMEVKIEWEKRSEKEKTK